MKAAFLSTALAALLSVPAQAAAATAPKPTVEELQKQVTLLQSELGMVVQQRDEKASALANAQVQMTLDQQTIQSLSGTKH